MGYAVTPEAVIRNHALSPQARFLWTLLASYLREGVNSCFPSQADLAQHAGTSTRSIRAWLSELEAAGLVTIKSRGSSKTAVYVIHGTISIASDRKYTSTQTGSRLPKEEPQRRFKDPAEPEEHIGPLTIFIRKEISKALAPK